jgi:hypothetical protein
MPPKTKESSVPNKTVKVVTTTTTITTEEEKPDKRTSRKPELAKTKTEQDLKRGQRNAFQRDISAVSKVQLPGKALASTSPPDEPKRTEKKKEGDEMKCTLCFGDGRDPISVKIRMPEDAGQPVVVKVPTLNYHYTVVVTKGGIRTEGVASFDVANQTERREDSNGGSDDDIDECGSAAGSEDLPVLGLAVRNAKEMTDRELAPLFSHLEISAMRYVARNKGKPTRDIRSALRSEGFRFTKKDLNKALHQCCAYHECEGYAYWYPKEK